MSMLKMLLAGGSGNSLPWITIIMCTIAAVIDAQTNQLCRSLIRVSNLRQTLDLTVHPFREVASISSN